MIQEWFLIIKDFAVNLSNYPIFIALIGGLFAGEIAIITLGFLSAQGIFNFWTIFIFFWIGEIIADLIYFELGRSKLFLKIKDLKKFSNVFNKIDEFISTISKKNVFLTLLYSKFVYGTRTAVVIYLGIKKINRKTFIFAEAGVMIIVVLLLEFIGWSAGKEYSFLMDNFKNIQITLSIIILSIMILYQLRKYINNILIKNKKRLKKWVLKKK